MSSRAPLPLTEFHDFSPSQTSTPLPTETPRPVNARRLQPAIGGAWGVAGSTPLPETFDWLEPAIKRGTEAVAGFRIPEADTLDWTALSDLFAN